MVYAETLLEPMAEYEDVMSRFYRTLRRLQELTENEDLPVEKYTTLSLDKRKISTFSPNVQSNDFATGRRLRIFSSLISSPSATTGYPRAINIKLPTSEYPSIPLVRDADNDPAFKDLTFGQLMAQVSKQPEWGLLKSYLEHIPLRVLIVMHSSPKIYDIKDVQDVVRRDPELPECLFDLSYEILSDVHEACYAFNNPDLYYPGWDSEIEPIPDTHVELVIAGLQRELNRETRGSQDGYGAKLPAVPLSDLPFNIQRALAERRRYHYTIEYGITRENWESGVFSLWNVKFDPDFLPRRHQKELARLKASGAVANNSPLVIPNEGEVYTGYPYGIFG